MHKSCLPSGVPCESPSAYEKSLVHKIFGGRLRSQVKCMECSFCSDKFDPFLDLSLEIENVDSLCKALTQFTAKELLDGGSRQYQCQRCKQKVKALKQLTIHNAPHVLTVHLKRFGSYVQGQKINKKIDFGPNLDLKPFVSGPYVGDQKYTLYGVLVHAGWSTHSGHYYCFVRTSSGMWYSLDDNQVVHVNERRVLEQKAYMLFYVQDRKNLPTKKPADVLQKENILMNGLGNAAHSKINAGSKENMQNDSPGTKLVGSSSATSAQRDVSNITAPKETMRNEGSLQKFNVTESKLDGSFSATKKPADVLQKENIVMNDLEHAAYSKFNLGSMENMQNGSPGTKLDGSFSGTSAQRDVSNITAPKETMMNEGSLQKVNGTGTKLDGSFPATKKPADILQKENIVMNDLGNAAYSKLNLGSMENVQNGSPGTKLDGSFSGTSAQRDVSNITAPKETMMNEGSLQKVNGTATKLVGSFSATKKPADVLHKENILMNDLGNAACSKFNLGSMENIQNGSPGTKLDGSFSATSAQKDVSDITAPKETMMNEESLQKVNGTVAVECLSLERNLLSEPFSVVPPKEDSVKALSAANIDSVDHVAKSVSSFNNSGDTPDLSHAAIIANSDVSCHAQQDLDAPAAVLSGNNEPQGSFNKKELNDFVAMPSSCNKDGSTAEHQRNTIDKPPNSSALLVSSGDVCKREDTNSGKFENDAMFVKANEEAWTKLDFTESLKKGSIEESQVGCSPGKSSDATDKDTHDTSPRVRDFESELCGLPATAKSSSPRKVDNKKPLLEVKKKVLKCQGVSMHLSSVIMFGLPFGLRKKNMRRKHRRSLRKNNPSPEVSLDGNGISPDLGPSTSDKSLPAHSLRFKRKKVKSVSVDKEKAPSVPNFNGRCEVPRDIINHEFRERVGQNGTILLTKTHQERSSGSVSERKQSAAEPSFSDNQRRKTAQNSMMNMLTRGLEESIVARWDGLDMSISGMTESRGVKTIQTGYIGDEWDEEYDRGKRKKVKGSNIHFGGSNLFQKVATTKHKRKNAKLDRSSSGNKPFRI